MRRCGVRASWLVALVVALATCEPADDHAPSPPPAPVRATRGVRGSDTNIFAADYIGPNACGECHAANFAKWAGSLHRVMNARADEPGAVVGHFDQTLAYRDGTATFSRDAAGYAMTLRRAGSAAPLRYAVTRTIGRRGLQEYVGRLGGSGDEVRLPFGWWPRAGGWFAQPSFDPWLGDGSGFDPYTPVAEPWAARCPWCHSTYPFAQRIARDKGHGLDQFFTLPDAPAQGSARLDVAAQVTTGISCESCHLGGRAHAAGAPIHLLPRGAQPRAGAPTASTFAEEARDARIVNTTCAQCHSGPSPRLPDGAALRNSSEAIDLAASPCTNIRCVDCHDPHAADTSDARAIAACTACHAPLADPVAARAHAGPHAPATATCLDCHMPRIVLGIDHHVRTHRISSPTDARLYALGAPNACNLCHLDRSVAWTVAALRDPWDVHLHLAPAPADTPALAGDAYLASDNPSFRLIAISAFVRRPDLHPHLPPPTLPYVEAWMHLLVRAPAP
jgi:hypothetical protein